MSLTQTMSLEEKFADLMAEHERNPEAKMAFQNDPVAALQAAHIPLVPTLVTDFGVLEGVGLSEHISVEKHWWGIDIVMNEKLTSDITHGLTGTGPIASAVAAALGAVGVVTGGVATALGAGLAAIFAAKVAEIKIIDDGKGVHWPITWIQWAALAAAVPTGPAGIVAAGMAFIHPVRNKK